MTREEQRQRGQGLMDGPLVPVPQGPGILLSTPSYSPEAPTRSPLCLSRSKEASVTCTEGGRRESQDFYNPIGSGTAHQPIRMKHRAWRCSETTL